MCITNYACLFNFSIATVENNTAKINITVFTMYRTDLEKATLLPSFR